MKWRHAGLWLGFVLIACDGHAATPLRVPLADSSPYHSIDKSGRVDGLVPALVGELAVALDRQVKFVPATPRGAQQGVRAGRFDLAVLPKSRELESDYIFTQNLFHYKYTVLTKPESDVEIRALADLYGKRVAVQSHDAGEILLSRHPAIERISVPDYMTGIRLVADGHAEFFVGDREVCLYLMNMQGAPFLRPAGTDLIRIPASFAVNKERTDLGMAIEEVVARLRADGTLDALSDEWLGGEFVEPAPTPWMLRYLKWLLVATAAVVIVLIGFVALLQILVKQRTKKLMAAQQSLQQSQERLARAQRMEMAGTLAGQIAHDFSNLLSPLIAFPDYIKNELPEMSPSQLDLELVKMAAQRIADINEQLLTLSRRGHYKQEPLQLNDVIREAMTHVERRTPPGINVHLELSEDLHPIRGGSSQLVRALSNMFINAIEAMGEHGTLRVSSRNVHLKRAIENYERVDPGDYVLVTIRDDGEGMPPQIHHKVFEPFFTTKKATRNRGSGLGLSVVHGVVKDHGGYIDVVSAEGEGTTFSLYFPVTHEALREEPEDLPAVRGGSESILVVDDDPMQILVCKRILEELGYRVEGVLGPDEAQAALRQHTIDAMVIDVVLERETDGVDLYQRIRKEYPDMPVIFMSGYAETTRVEMARKMGARIFLKKPMSARILGEALRSELDR